MKKKEKNNQGFTLVEILIAIAMLTIAVTPLISNFISSAKINGKAKRVLKATEISQNMFEGMTSVNPRDMITELSGHAEQTMLASGGVRKMSFLPAGATCEKVYEYVVKEDPNTNQAVLDANGKYQFELNMAGASYTKTKKTLEDSSVKYIGFKETEHKLYRFALVGVNQEGKKYDMRITMDATTYDGYVNAHTTEAEKEEVVTRARISAFNSGYDAISLEGASELQNVVTTEFKNKRVNSNSGKSEAEILKKLKRTYYIDIEEITATTNREVTVNVTTEYEYLNIGEINVGEDAVYVTAPEQIYTSTTSGLDPRNIYIYYTPNYNSKQGSVLDNIVIRNNNDLDVNVYIIRMQQTNGILQNISTITSEDAYSASLTVEEGNTTDVVFQTKVRTNLDDNIMKTDQPLAGRRRTLDRNYYYYKSAYGGVTPIGQGNGLESGVTDIMENTIFEIKGLDAQKEESRFYDVTIEVYEGSTQENGVSFDEKKKLAEFTGSIVE